MASPNVRVNTFFQQKHIPSIDIVSKLYIGAASLVGLNRLPVILNKAKYILTSLAVVYSLFLCAGLIYKIHNNADFKRVAVIINFFEYLFCIIYSFLTWKRMKRYYDQLNKFDTEIGCRPKVTSQVIKNFVFMAFFSALLPIVYGLSSQCVSCNNVDGYLVVFFAFHCQELHFYGHLLGLLVPRLRLINYFVETALSSGMSAKCPNVEEFVSFKSKNTKNTEMKKLMDLYHIAIKAYDSLIEAIKWQLLVIIIATFISTLTFCYHSAGSIINKQQSLAEILNDLGNTGSEMIPLFSPCMFGDRVHGEVRRLRELLASRLYENKLDKSGRSAARALLALTEARDLSFSLLRMLQVDISLPFKFIGLLVTYLIILLQFEKVINPSTAPTLTTIMP